MGKQSDNPPREAWDIMRAISLLIRQIDHQLLNEPVSGTMYLVIKRENKIPVTRSTDPERWWMPIEMMNPSMEGVLGFPKDDARRLVLDIDGKDEPYYISATEYLTRWKARLRRALDFSGKLYAAASEMRAYLERLEWGARIGFESETYWLREKARKLKL